MKTKLIPFLMIAISVLFFACDEDSIIESVLGTNNMTLSGDINKTIDASSIAGLIVEDSTSIFTIFVQPKNSLSINTDVLGMTKLSEVIPPVGSYKIGTEFLVGNDFLATYSLNDSTIYFMSTGTVKITKSSSSKVEGTFDLSGYQLTFPVDSTRVLNIAGEFSTIPQDLD